MTILEIVKQILKDNGPLGLIELLKHLRERSGLGLKECKDGIYLLRDSGILISPDSAHWSLASPGRLILEYTQNDRNYRLVVSGSMYYVEAKTIDLLGAPSWSVYKSGQLEKWQELLIEQWDNNV